MPYTPGANDAFQSGVNHQALDSHENTSSVTLDGALQRDSDHWNALTPHGVLNTALGGSAQNDSSWELMQRTQGGYQPGSMPGMEDQIEQGSDE
jgi:hypothetical protein